MKKKDGEFPFQKYSLPLPGMGQLRNSIYYQVFVTLKHTGKLRSFISTGLWKGQAYWCFQTALRTVFCKYWSWLVLRPFGWSFGFDCSPEGQDGAGEPPSLASESFCEKVNEYSHFSSIQDKWVSNSIQNNFTKHSYSYHFERLGITREIIFITGILPDWTLLNRVTASSEITSKKTTEIERQIFILHTYILP